MIHLQAYFSTVGCKQGFRCSTTVPLAVREFQKEGKQTGGFDFQTKLSDIGLVGTPNPYYLGLRPNQSIIQSQISRQLIIELDFITAVACLNLPRT